ncbi:hypothetical protein J4414_03875 [Candidatus Woesearchaeota archaeon]|nr:hypothetical protein [Candidatus Woesearchaeota archaeon]
MDKCEICGEDWDMKSGNHTYCAVHYVENEDEECLYWDLHGIEEGNDIGRTLESQARIWEEIKKKYPEHLKRYYRERKEKLKEHYEEMEKLSESELRRLADIMGVGLNESEDKEEIILILSTEPLEKIRDGLKKLKGADPD